MLLPKPVATRKSRASAFLTKNAENTEQASPAEASVNVASSQPADPPSRSFEGTSRAGRSFSTSSPGDGAKFGDCSRVVEPTRCRMIRSSEPSNAASGVGDVARGCLGGHEGPLDDGLRLLLEEPTT